MTYFVTYFSHSKDGKYLPLLRAWFRALRAVDTTTEAAILTDALTIANNGDVGREFGVQCLIVSPTPFKDCIRPGNHFDHKSALICAALPLLPRESVVFDCDAIIQRDPSNALEAYANEPFAMPPDSGKRTLPWRTAGGEIRLPEHSSSVLMFGSNCPAMREALVEDYRKAWHWLAGYDDAQGIICQIREQRAWSLVHYWAEGVLMEPRLNWSPYHWKPNADAFIVHHHGQKKFTDIR